MTELEYAKAYNTEFSRLNPGVPVNTKWDAIQQMNYLKQLLARQQARGGTGYLFPNVDQLGNTPPTPAVTPTPVTPPTTIPTNTPVSLLEALNSARYVVKQLEALVQQG